MCDPVTATVTALSIGSAAVGQIGAREAADAARDQALVQRRQQAEEINAQAEAQLGSRVAEGRRARARMLVAGGEAGIGGQSFEMQIANSLGIQNQDAALIAQNSRFQDRASQSNYASIVAQNSGPTLLESGLAIAGAGVQGYSSGLQIKGARNSLNAGG